MKNYLRQGMFWFVLVFVLALLFYNANAQSYSVSFHWEDPNVTPCNYDVYEVSAPPDTDKVLWVCNHDPIPNCKTGCSWSMPVWPDNKDHYYRVRAYASNDYFSPLSNTAKARFGEPLKAVHLINITF